MNFVLLTFKIQCLVLWSAFKFGFDRFWTGVTFFLFQIWSYQLLKLVTNPLQPVKEPKTWILKVNKTKFNLGMAVSWKHYCANWQAKYHVLSFIQKEKWDRWSSDICEKNLNNNVDSATIMLCRQVRKMFVAYVSIKYATLKWKNVDTGCVHIARSLYAAITSLIQRTLPLPY